MPQERSQASGAIQEKLERLFQDLERLQAQVKTQKSNPVRISQSLRGDLVKICKEWNDEILVAITSTVPTERVNLINSTFQPLKEVSLKRASHIRRDTLINAIEQILEMSEQILFDVVYPRPVQETTNFFSPLISKLEQLNLPQTLSLSLLKESNACFPHSTRAAVILSWSASVALLHDAVELNGFEEFNSNLNRAAQKKGRFERLSAYKTQLPQISTRSRLIQFNEGHLLLVLEEMNFYGEDGGKLLDWCFSLRNQAAHPTDFSPTQRILEMYRGTLEEYVFANRKITALFQQASSKEN